MRRFFDVLLRPSISYRKTRKAFPFSLFRLPHQLCDGYRAASYLGFAAIALPCFGCIGLVRGAFLELGPKETATLISWCILFLIHYRLSGSWREAAA